MARSTFGGRPGDYTILDPTTTGGVVTVAASQTGGTVWSASSGGTQYTDLLVAGSPVTTVSSSSNGTVIPFQGPDGVNTGVWVSFGGGPRVLLDPQVISSNVDVTGPVAAAVLGNTFGIAGGQTVKPWAPSPVIGPELWQVSKFQSGAGYNSSTLTPSLTGNGTGQTLSTRINMGDQGNGDRTFRLEFDYTVPNNGWGGISLASTTNAAVVHGGSQEQWLVSTGSQRLTGHYLFDFKPPAASGDMYLQVKLRLENNVASGSLSLSNVSLKQTGDVSRPLLLSQEYSTGAFPLVWWQAYDVPNRSWKVASESFAADGTTIGFVDCAGYSTDQPFSTALPDPSLTRTTVGLPNSTDIAFVTATGNSLRIGNNDQIMSVFNGSAYEYRGNTHGGEVDRGAATFKVDYGAGLVAWTLSRGLTGCRRFQIALPSEYRRSVDGTTAYANVDRTITAFPDGMTRVDRTTTFLSTQSYQDFFEWMSSHDTTVPYLGRIGRGLTVLAEIDTHPLAAVPGTPGSSTSTSGGTLAAATYSYKVTALTPYGETTPSAAKTQVTTGSTSTVTLTWSAVTNATGYKVYGRVAGVERHLVTLPAVLTWIDTGANGGNAQPPTVNTARYYDGTTALMSAHSTDARWAVWREPRTGWCFGNIYDSESALARSQVGAVRTRIERGSGIQKDYANLWWSNGSDVISIPAATVWTATHWCYAYIPEDPNRWHTEIAVKAAALAALKTLYPAT